MSCLQICRARFLSSSIRLAYLASSSISNPTQAHLRVAPLATVVVTIAEERGAEAEATAVAAEVMIATVVADAGIEMIVSVVIASGIVTTEGAAMKVVAVAVETAALTVTIVVAAEDSVRKIVKAAVGVEAEAVSAVISAGAVKNYETLAASW